MERFANREDHAGSERWVTTGQHPLSSHLLSGLDELEARVRPDVASAAGHQHSRRKSHGLSAVHRREARRSRGGQHHHRWRTHGSLEADVTYLALVVAPLLLLRNSSSNEPMSAVATMTLLVQSNVWGANSSNSSWFSQMFADVFDGSRRKPGFMIMNPLSPTQYTPFG